MTVTVLYPEDRQIPDLALEQEVFGPEVRLVRAAKLSFAELDPNDCAATDGLMIMRWAVTAADLDRFPRLRCVVRSTKVSLWPRHRNSSASRACSQFALAVIRTRCVCLKFQACTRTGGSWPCPARL